MISPSLKILLFLLFSYSLFIVYNQFTFFALSYDESLFINAAIGKDEVTFIYKHWHGIPIMVMDYIGALKSWLYIPIFKLFGVNIYSIRVPMVILMYINFYLIYIITLKYFDKLIAIALVLLLFTDFTFINLHKIDHGPNALETFIKLLCIYFINKKQKPLNTFLVFSLLTIGIFNKLNFIWFINALFGVYFISSLKQNLQIEGNIWGRFFEKKFVLNCFLYLFLLILFIIILKIQNINPSTPSQINEVITHFIYQFNHLIFVLINLRYEYVLGWNSEYPFTFIFAKITLLSIIILNIFWLFKKPKYLQNTHNQLFILVSLLAIQLFLTKEATNIWHDLMLYPFIQLLIISTIFILWGKNSNNTKVIFSSFIGIWLCYNIFTYYNFQQKINEKCNYWLYDPTINKLIDYTQNRPEKTIISLGAGIHSQLLVLDKKDKKYIELIANNSNSDFNGILASNKIINFENVLIVENLNSNLDMNRTHYMELEKIVKAKGLFMNEVTTINDGCEKPLYIIFKASK